MPPNERPVSIPRDRPAAAVRLRESRLARLVFGRRRAGRSKTLFFVRGLLSLLVPRAWYRARRGRLLASIAGRPDRDEIEARAAYCCKPGPGSLRMPPPGTPVPEGDPVPMRVRDQPFPWKKHVYYFDSRECLRYFPGDLVFAYWPGDKTRVPSVPAFVKSRPVAGNDGNSVLLALNRIRHFFFVDRDVPFAEKDDVAVFRGTVRNKPKRIRLFERWFGAPGLDLGDTSKRAVRPEWAAPEASVEEQLRHKFVLCIEGNDVSSNLKWVFSSNSVAVMPRPEFETWFQEGLLVPGVHYVEVKSDFSDLQERLDWYRARPEACERIVEAAHAWAARFRDPVREKLVSLLVADRYFRATGQSV